METRANYALIGAFTLAVLVAGFAFVYWFSGGDKHSMRKSYRIVFNGSVSGLSRGSEVLFNGLRVGEVREIDLMQEDPSRVAAIVDVNNRTPVKTDTRARLEVTGLTGVASIALSGGSAIAKPLEAEANGERPIIYAEPSTLQNLLESIQKLASKSDSVLDRADQLLAQNGGTIHETIQNVQTFSKSLADNSGGVSQFLASMGDVGRAIGPLAQRLDGLSSDLDVLVKSIDPAKVRSIVANADRLVADSDKLIADSSASVATTLKNVQSFSQALADNSQGVNRFLASMSDVGKAVGPLVQKLDRLSTDIDTVVKAVEPERVQSILANTDKLIANGNKLLSTSSEPLSASIRNFEGFSKMLADNSPQVDQFLRSVAEASKSLPSLTQRLDQVSVHVEGIVKSVDPEKIKTIVANANTFSAALAKSDQNITALLSDGAILAKHLNETAGHLDGLITGASNIAHAIDPAKVSVTLDNLTDFSAALGQNRGNIERILNDTSSLAGKLNHDADKIDSLLTEAQNFLGQGGNNKGGVFTDVAEAARSIKKLADNLDQRTKEITAGFNRLTGPTAREYDALAGDARRSLNELNRTVRSIQQNPQQFIFGSRPAIPEYTPQ
jgi:phospholipid/cholesterol/gamma-HCH transport system substrate-binding protein